MSAIQKQPHFRNLAISPSWTSFPGPLAIAELPPSLRFASLTNRSLLAVCVSFDLKRAPKFHRYLVRIPFPLSDEKYSIVYTYHIS